MSNVLSGFDAATEIVEEEARKNQKYSWFKATDTPKQIRFIQTDEDSISSFGEHYVQFQNEWFKPYSCPDFRNEAQATCAICKIKAGKNGDLLKNDFSSKFVMNIIERDAHDPDEKGHIPSKGVDTLKVYKFSIPLYTIIGGLIKEFGSIGDRDYMVSLVKPIVNGKTKAVFIVEPVTQKPVALTKADKALIAEKPQLIDTVPKYDEMDFYRIMAMNKTFKPTGHPGASTDVDDFLNSANTDDILSSLPVKSKSAVSEAEDSSTENPEFFANLRRNGKS